MRTSALTVLFVAFFALFAPVAYAAPVPPEIVARQGPGQCGQMECRYITVTNPSNTSSYINSTQTGSAAPVSNFSSTTNSTTSSTAVATPLPTGFFCLSFAFSPKSGDFWWFQTPSVRQSSDCAFQYIWTASRAPVTSDFSVN
ncbi:hypothetical protein BC827DRAFT_1320428 [Russula dissimulans]|nr:hypothetical protein BC827DRAFT_1320428 [Russula dissimulans]